MDISSRFKKFRKFDRSGKQLTQATRFKSARVKNVDTNRVAASAIISTPRFDRENDSLNPMGGDYSDYEMNPVVLWDHGLGHDMPIGKSMEDGRLLVYPNEERIKAECLFSQSNKMAMQIFGMVNEGTINATSIRFTPTERPIRKSDGNRYERWKCDEWSWTVLGMNPDCVAEMISKSFVIGWLGSMQLEISTVTRFEGPRTTTEHPSDCCTRLQTSSTNVSNFPLSINQ